MSDLSVITKQKADHLLRLPVELKACNMQLGLFRHGAVDKKLWILALWILISGGILNGIFTCLAHAGALYIYEAGNPKEGFVSGQYDDVFLTFLSFYVQLN